MEEELIGDQRLDKLKGHIKKHKHEWRRFIICVIGIGKILGVCVATPIPTGLRFIAPKIVSWFHDTTVSFRTCNALVFGMVKLELPSESVTYPPCFHVSLLKKKLGDKVSV